MDKRETRLSCREARELDMVDYLSGLGHEPAKIKGRDFWYLSPLRNEQTASFKVNRKLNRWYDYGLGKGGNLIDFAIAYHGCTVGEFLASLQDDFFFHQPSRKFTATSNQNEQDKGIKILEVKSIFHPVLLDYLQERRIPVSIAECHCCEVHYRVGNKSYFAIGFANDEGGYELRNAYFKGSSSPKDVTTITSGNDELAVFEGFTDFLSLVVMMGWQQPYPVDVLVLNSLAFFERSFPLMGNYSKVGLYLDNDTAGQNCRRMAIARSGRFVDGSGLYENYKDLNDWLRHFGNSVPPANPVSNEPP